MEATTVNTAMAELVKTLNGLVQSGAEKMPETAKMLVEELSRYYTGIAISNGIQVFVSMTILVVIAWACFKGPIKTAVSWAEKDYSEGEIGVAAVSVAGSFIAAVISAIWCLASFNTALDSMVKAIAPVGAILARQL